MYNLKIVGKAISTVESTKVLCPLFDKTEILIPGDSLSIIPFLGKMSNFNSVQKRRKNDY